MSTPETNECQVILHVRQQQQTTALHTFNTVKKDIGTQRGYLTFKLLLN
jgi:heme-degrading monooxygenase HmoA